MPAINRFAFLVELPDGDRDEYGTAGEDLTAEQAVERAYEKLPAGSSIVKPLRGEVPGNLDLSPPEGSDDVSEEADDSESEDSEDDGEAVPPFSPAEYTVSDIESELADGDFSDAELEALLKAERIGQDRNGAVAAIEEERDA
jgi:hypothetical protein